MNDPTDFETRLQDAVRRRASMAEIAAIKAPAIDSPEGAIQALKSGNARFFGGQGGRPELGANERRAQIMGQTPFAAVLACSDSRVPVELVFDQGFGDLFVVRVAGNVVSPGALGSIEYAITHLNVRLLVVLGHEGCGAVKAAMLPPEQVAREPEFLRFVIGCIEPGVRGLPRIRDPKARMREAVLNNVRWQAAGLRANPTVAGAEAGGQLRVIGGFYEIGSGAVDFLTDEDELAP